VFKLFKIQGDSLYPLVKEGEVVFCIKLCRFNTININDLVLFNHKVNGFMIKKVSDINDKGYFVKGENPSSYDSRDFGELKKEDLLYKVIYHFSKN